MRKRIKHQSSSSKQIVLHLPVDIYRSRTTFFAVSSCIHFSFFASSSCMPLEVSGKPMRRAFASVEECTSARRGVGQMNLRGEAGGARRAQLSSAHRRAVWEERGDVAGVDARNVQGRWGRARGSRLERRPPPPPKNSERLGNFAVRAAPRERARPRDKLRPPPPPEARAGTHLVVVFS